MSAAAPEAGFAQSYAEARGMFVAATEAAGLDVEEHVHPLVGRDGERLSMDVVREGPPDAACVLIVSSGCHGAEGYCGSGIQNALLADREFRCAARDAGVAVLHVHALNPYGFSWIRRVTHENVDLNRNWHDFSRPLPRNTAYDDIAHWAVPATWPPPPEAEAGLAAYAAQHGARALQTAFSAGQYHHPEGLFFGGHRPTWSRQTLTHVLEQHTRRCRRLAWVDLHTGLGPSGHGERIFADRDDAQALARARRWWGDAVTSIYDGSSTSALLTGMIFEGVYEVCPDAEYTGMAIEYGTLAMDEVLAALRADQWLYNHPEVEGEPRAAIKRQVRDAFYVDTVAWKRQVVSQAVEAAYQAVQGLSSSAAG